MDNASKQNSDQKPQHVKIEFHVPDEDGKTNIETMWAIDLGNNLYQLDNLPFYAYGISWHDKFKAEKQNEQGFAKFKEVTEKSGNKNLGEPKVDLLRDTFEHKLKDFHWISI